MAHVAPSQLVGRVCVRCVSGMVESVGSSLTAPDEVLVVAINHRIDTLILVRKGQLQSSYRLRERSSSRVHDAGALRELEALLCLRVGLVVRRIECNETADSRTSELSIAAI